MATSTESEVLACVTIIRAHRQSPNPHAPPEAAVPWAIGNLRIYDPTRNAPPLRLSAVRDADVRLDVVVKGMATPLEQWRIMPGTPSDATALSLLMRSLVFHLRLGELYDVIKKRDDVEVVVSSGPALVDDSAHRLIFSCGTDSPTTVQVVINDTWRSVLLERDNKLRDPDGLGFPGDETEAASAKDHPLDDRSEDSGFSVGSFPAMPTPPMAPRMPVVGSFGTSPRVGQPSAVGSFVLPATVAQSSPAMSFAVPKSEMEDMPPLVPLSSAMTGFASPNTPNAILSLSALALDGLPRTASEPTAANAFSGHGTSLPGAPFTSRQNHVPFGIGSSSCDLDDYHSSPASKEASKTPEFPATATLAFDGRSDATVDQEHRAAVTEFLGALQDFVPRVKGAPTAVSVTDAIKLVLEA